MADQRYRWSVGYTLTATKPLPHELQGIQGITNAWAEGEAWGSWRMGPGCNMKGSMVSTECNPDTHHAQMNVTLPEQSARILTRPNERDPVHLLAAQRPTFNHTSEQEIDIDQQAYALQPPTTA